MPTGGQRCRPSPGRFHESFNRHSSKLERRARWFRRRNQVRSLSMMVLPFIGFAGSAVAILAGRRGAAIGLWLASLLSTLGLFAAHATSTLQLDF
ncbi:DUF5993 family protein [Methylobacterium sp. J-070]|jgi:Family of unknown function (DUF5993)|uniref:DUF5993 family protein n=1 Tax=Methylobacterium sp. J-070 TaxID=2836650 RepID=UPI001FBA558F|nr:DUF5993 family protein [Methylobacterium sp. J-070]MCJ2053759.1 DUF5993 family protein [Methylobacterium sp. J-070]